MNDRAKLTVVLPQELVDEARDAVVYLMQTRDSSWTMRRLIEEAITEKLDRENDGNPYPPRREDLRPGRRVD